MVGQIAISSIPSPMISFFLSPHLLNKLEIQMETSGIAENFIDLGLTIWKYKPDLCLSKS
jgi:hypothetical protein